MNIIRSHLPRFRRHEALGFALLVGLWGGSCLRAEEETEGQAWGRIIRHCDGTYTKSRKDGDKNEIKEEKFDANNVLMAIRRYLLDSKGFLRKGVILDAKEKPLGSTEYSYDSHDRIKEERLYNAHGELIQRKFPPGALPGVPENARHHVAFTIDPKNPRAVGKLIQTDEPLVKPVVNPEDSFEPGMPIGQQISKDPLGLPNNTTPVPTTPKGRKPLLRQKTTP